MARGRFRLLERRSEGEEPEAEAPPRGDEDAPSVVARRLERDGELRLDHSGAPDTHFCRTCGAENPAGSNHCYNCGLELGGPEQAAFDALMREELARRARERAREEATVEETPVVEAAPAEAAPEPVTEERKVSTARGRQVRAYLATGIVSASLFALIAATLHLFAAGFTHGKPPWLILVEILVTLVVTVLAYWRLADWIEGL